MWCFCLFVAFFEFIQQAALVNFMLYFNIFRVLKISFRTFWISRLVSLDCKFHIEIFRYSFTRDKKFLLIPSHFLPGIQEKHSSSASKHVNNSLSVYFFLDSELSNGRMKVQVKRAFESYFLSPKKTTTRKQTGSTWNFLQPSIQMYRGV